MALRRHITRLSATSIAALVATMLAGCGSDDNSSAAAPVDAQSQDSQAVLQCGGKASLLAEGSTSQLNAMNEFRNVWAHACPGKTVGYNATGSGAGVDQFVAGQVDFAGSSSALTDDQRRGAEQRCSNNAVWHLPLVFGAVALVYNLGDGIHDLVMNASVLADVFQGRITRWNDPAIVALNGTATMPDLAITPIFRSDSSGTTDNFQAYLSAAAPDHWRDGAGTEFHGGAGEGVAKSSGVVQAVRVTPGAIGYVEVSPTFGSGLPFARIDSGSGAVALDNSSIGRVISAAKVGAGHDLVIDLGSIYASKDAGTYPLIMATYEVICSKGYDPDTQTALKSFLASAVTQGQANLANIGFVPLPNDLGKRVQSAIAAVG